jgi:hypothetical protein
MTILVWTLGITAFAIGVLIYYSVGYAFAKMLRHYDGLLAREHNLTRKDQIIEFVLYPIDLLLRLEGTPSPPTSDWRWDISEPIWRWYWPLRLILSLVGIILVAIALLVKWVGKKMDKFARRIYNWGERRSTLA